MVIANFTLFGSFLVSFASFIHSELQYPYLETTFGTITRHSESFRRRLNDVRKDVAQMWKEYLKVSKERGKIVSIHSFSLLFHLNFYLPIRSFGTLSMCGLFLFDKPNAKSAWCEDIKTAKILSWKAPRQIRWARPFWYSRNLLVNHSWPCLNRIICSFV